MVRPVLRRCKQAMQRHRPSPRLYSTNAAFSFSDDYYLNLLDWNSSNVLGVALGDSIYLWNATDGSIQQLMHTAGENSHVTSLSWEQKGT